MQLGLSWNGEMKILKIVQNYILKHVAITLLWWLWLSCFPCFLPSCSKLVVFRLEIALVGPKQIRFFSWFVLFHKYNLGVFFVLGHFRPFLDLWGRADRFPHFSVWGPALLWGGVCLLYKRPTFSVSNLLNNYLSNLLISWRRRKRERKVEKKEKEMNKWNQTGARNRLIRGRSAVQ